MVIIRVDLIKIVEKSMPVIRQNTDHLINNIDNMGIVPFGSNAKQTLHFLRVDSVHEVVVASVGGV